MIYLQLKNRAAINLVYLTEFNIPFYTELTFAYPVDYR